MLVDFVASLDGTAVASVTGPGQVAAMGAPLAAVGRHSLRGEMDADEAFGFYRSWIPGIKAAFDADPHGAYAQLTAAAADHGDWSWVGAAHLMAVGRCPATTPIRGTPAFWSRHAHACVAATSRRSS